MHCFTGHWENRLHEVKRQQPLANNSRVVLVSFKDAELHWNGLQACSNPRGGHFADARFKTHRLNKFKIEFLCITSQNSSSKTKSCSLKLLLISLSAGCTYAVCTRGAGVSLSQKGKEATQTAKSKLAERTRGTLMCFFK